MRWIFLLCLLHLTWGKHEMYDGHSLYKVEVDNVQQTKFVNGLENEAGFDVLEYAVPGRPGQVLVPKELKQQFQMQMAAAGVKVNVEIENVKDMLDLEDSMLADARRRSNNTRNGALAMDRVYTYEEVNEYMEELAASYPDIVTLATAGHSFEGRPIKYLKISTTNFEDNNKPVVIMESLIHAREWIALSATLYAMEKLIVDVTESDLLQTIDWVIIPVVNPDGYVFSHEENRLWRKNRATGYMIGDTCMGVDLNRNFDFFWAQHSSNLVCIGTFHGRAAFSEPEARAIRDIVLEHNNRLELFLDIHSFGSMILYGYGTRELPANVLWVHMVGVNMAQAIDRVKMDYNPDYVVGNSAAVLYEASGSASDYAQWLGATYSYTYELPGYRFGVGGLGFLVDPDFVRQAGYETWEGIKVAARYARDNY